MDWNKIATLLHITDKVRGLPSLKAIHDEAMGELEKIANPPSKGETVAKPPMKPPLVDPIFPPGSEDEHMHRRV